VSGTHFVMHASCGAAPEFGESGGAAAEGPPLELALPVAASGVGTDSGSPKVQIFSPGGQIKGSHRGAAMQNAVSITHSWTHRLPLSPPKVQSFSPTGLNGSFWCGCPWAPSSRSGPTGRGAHS
jgi:hypothetical protein